jgi:hypothetical protein
MAIKEADMLDFSTDEFEKLTAQFQNLRTFEEVTDWDSRAKQAIESVNEFVRNMQTEKAKTQSNLHQLEDNHEGKSFFGKMLGGKKELNQLEEKINKTDALIVKCESLINNIQSKIDITPNTPEEQTNLLKELLLEKKELTLKKREINTQMKEIRTAARQKSVNSTDSLVGVLAGSKYRAATRRGIRYQKEQMLNPHEDEKSYIERQLLQIEKDILWVERFKYLNPPKDNSNINFELSE